MLANFACRFCLPILLAIFCQGEIMVGTVLARNLAKYLKCKLSNVQHDTQSIHFGCVIMKHHIFQHPLQYLYLTFCLWEIGSEFRKCCVPIQSQILCEQAMANFCSTVCGHIQECALVLSHSVVYPFHLKLLRSNRQHSHGSKVAPDTSKICQIQLSVWPAWPRQILAKLAKSCFRSG